MFTNHMIITEEKNTIVVPFVSKKPFKGVFGSAILGIRYGVRMDKTHTMCLVEFF